MKLLWFKSKKQPPRQPRLMQGQNDYVFRRSRTLTGSVSPQVAAGAEARGRLKTDRTKLMELRSHRQHILRLLGLVLVVALCLAFLLVNFILTPDIYFVQKGARGVAPDKQTYQQALGKYFGDHPFERLGFALQPEAVERDLKRIHSELASVTVERAWYGGEVRFNLAFRKPLLVWRVQDSKFYVDGEGVAFNYNHFAEPHVSVVDESGIPPDDAGVIASVRFVSFLGRMVQAVNGYKLGQVTSVIIPQSTREIDLKLKGRDYLIRTHIDRDPLQQAEDIAFALRHFDKQGITPRYVDVRVAHKAFYKD